MGKNQEKTNVMRVLEQKKIPYESHNYLETGAVSGLDVARVLGEDPDRAFKTLVTVGKSKEHYVFVVPVSKLTNSVGETTDVSAVVATSDTLWTLSYSEIGGQMSTDDPGHDAVYNAEGAQYQLFSDLGVRWDSPNQILQIAFVRNFH